MPKITCAVINNGLNSRYIEKAKRRGWHLELLPPLRGKSAFQATRVDDVLAGLRGYDWLVFEDIRSAGHFAERIKDAGCDANELDSVPVCVRSSSIAEVLGSRMIHTDLIPGSALDEGIIEAIGKYEMKEASLEGVRVLSVSSSPPLFLLAERLREMDASVDELCVLKLSVLSDEWTRARGGGLLFGGGVDRLLFCSPEEVFDLLFLFRSADFLELFREMCVHSGDIATKRTLSEFGIPSTLLKEKTGR